MKTLETPREKAIIASVFVILLGILFAGIGGIVIAILLISIVATLYGFYKKKRQVWKPALIISILVMIGMAVFTLLLLNSKMSQTTNVKVQDHTEADRLLHEADSLIRMDSAFSYRNSNSAMERSAVKDNVIRAKLDSAILVDPHYKKAYLGSFIYLQQCHKFREVLPLLRQIEEKAIEPMDAELRMTKAMLEDIMGNRVTAHKDYQLADSAYQVLLEKYKNDSRYAAYQFNRILNLSLMNNDFSLMRNHLILAREKDSLIEGASRFEHFKNKQECYQYLVPTCFNVP